MRSSPGSTKVLLTREVTALPEDVPECLVGAVKAFDAFTEDNDPYGEHDFGAIELDGERYWCPECEDHPRRLVLRRDFENGRGESENPPISWRLAPPAVDPRDARTLDLLAKWPYSEAK